MNGEKGHRFTFAALDKKKGIELPPATGEEFPLPTWYRAVREIPLDELSIEDICKACRQQIHLDHVVPLALKLLESDPLSGEMYDGELLVSLKSIPVEYWSRNKTEKVTLESIIVTRLRQEELTNDVREDVRELVSKLASCRTR